MEVKENTIEPKGVEVKGRQSKKVNKNNEDKSKKEIKKYKEFQVDYLRLFEEKVNQDGEIISNNPIDISKVLEKCKKDNVEKRIRQHKGDIIRLQNIEKLTMLSDNLDGCKNIWSLHFIRIKVNVLSGVATNSGEFSETLLNEKLAENQHLAESTACLYDADNQLLIISRNRDGVMPSAIIEYFRSVSKNKMITYGVIPNDVKISSKKSNIYRKLIIGINDVDTMESKHMKMLKNIPSVFSAINGFKGYGYCNIKIELSMGSAPKNESMNNKKLKDTSLKLIESDIPNVNKLEISSKEDSESSIEVIDLLNNKVKDSFKVGFTRKDPILFSKLQQNLITSYNKKKEVIDKNIKNS